MITYLGNHVFKKNTIKVQRGDYSGVLKGMVHHLTEAEVNLKYHMIDDR